MPINRIPIWYPFLLAIVFAFFGSLFFSNFRLIAFAPFFAIIFFRKPLHQALWIVGGCGLLIDLLSSQMRFGIYALNYAATALIMHPQRRHFFNEKPLALPIYTSLISFLSTSIEFFLLPIFDKGFSLTIPIFLTEFIAMPTIDAIYAFLWFTCPIRFYEKIDRLGWLVAIGFKKKKNSEEEHASK